MSRKILLSSLNSLSDLFKDCANSATTNERRETFQSGIKQCELIITNINTNDISKAASTWASLMCFSNDSVGGSEQFLAKYQPLKQKIINAGLR